MALAGATAVIAYRTAPRCASFLERFTARGASLTRIARTRLTPPTDACAAPQDIAVDPANATAFVLMRSRHGSRLLTATRSGRTGAWRGLLSERVDALVAAGSGRVVLESNGAPRNEGEQCGGANPSFTQTYRVRVFDGARLVRSGHLQAGVYNC